MNGPRDHVVLGGGLAGLSAALALAERIGGARVLLLEARPVLGGRAASRSDSASSLLLDVGPHLMIAGYRETLGLLERLGAAETVEVQDSLSIEFRDEAGRASRLEAPPLAGALGLLAGVLGFRALPWRERLGAIGVVLRLGLDGAPDGRNAAAWLAAAGQRAGSRARMCLWDPIVLSTLNQTPERASATLLRTVLRRGFRSAGSSRLVLPRVPLEEVFARPAARRLAALGAEVRTRARAAAIEVEEAAGGWRLTGVRLAGGERFRGRRVVAAVPPGRLLALLPGWLAASEFFARASRLGTSPIASVEMWLDRELFAARFVALPGRLFHWVFARGRSPVGRAAAHGYRYSLVASAAEEAMTETARALAERALADLVSAFPEAGAARLLRFLVRKDPAATLSHAPGEEAGRLPAATPLPGLFLAGGWTATGLPDTIEGAILSGRTAADAALA